MVSGSESNIPQLGDNVSTREAATEHRSPPRVVASSYCTVSSIMATTLAPLQEGLSSGPPASLAQTRIRHSGESARAFLRGGDAAHRQGIACAPCRPRTPSLKVEEPSDSGPHRQVERLTPSGLPASSRFGPQPRVRTRRRWLQTADRTQRSVLLRSNGSGEWNRLVGLTENAQLRTPRIQGQATRPSPGMPAEATRWLRRRVPGSSSEHVTHASRSHLRNAIRAGLPAGCLTS